MNEQKIFLNSMTVLQETYFRLAKGKLLNLPEIEKAMRPIRSKYRKKKNKVERDFNRTREALMKRIPAGERLDRSLKKLQADRDRKMNKIELDLKSELEPYLKQKQIHDDLLKN